MFWVQVIVALGVVLGTVLVAGGRGDALGELTPDRPPARLPDDREVRAEDVNTLRLGVGLRGYRMDEVDDVLDVLADELTRRDEELAELRGVRRVVAPVDQTADEVRDTDG
jgi:DivIVA domain-containing protein